MSKKTAPPTRKFKRKRNRKFLLIFLIIIVAGFSIKTFFSLFYTGAKVKKVEGVDVPDWVSVELIDIDGSSRRGVKLDDIRDIVIHYVGNPGTTAQQNRGFFANSSSGISSHFLVGLEGEIIQCVPMNEKSSASNWRNNDTISIEVCHPDDTGKFNDVTYGSLVKLTAWLCDTFELQSENIIRHYDITGKGCPRYFVNNEDAWQLFKDDVSAYRQQQAQAK